MKKILITGAHSFVGTSFKEWMARFPNDYLIDTISLRDNDWKNKSFEGYDVVLHTVGIAHVDAKPDMEELYYKVNRDLAIEAAVKSKKDKVKQFIFLSSIIVYGDHKENKGVIDLNTIPKPKNFYGNSKLQAEESIKLLENVNFKIAVIRPPMIYGKNSKGNYPKLAKAAKILPVFPNFDNQRSMLHIDNLSEFLKLIIENEESGLFFPQNKEYVKTSEMVKVIAEVHGKKIKLIKIFNPILKLMIGKVNIVNKVFGNLIYDNSISSYEKNYHIKNLRESIKATEK